MLINDELARVILRERQEQIRQGMARYRLLERPRGCPAPWRRLAAQVYRALRRRMGGALAHLTHSEGAGERPA